MLPSLLLAITKVLTACGDHRPPSVGSYNYTKFTGHCSANPAACWDIPVGFSLLFQKPRVLVVTFKERMSHELFVLVCVSLPSVFFFVCSFYALKVKDMLLAS